MMDMELSNVERALPPRPQAQGASLAAPGKLPHIPPLPEGVVNEIDPQVQAMAQRSRPNVLPDLPPMAGADRAASSLQPPKPLHEPLSKMLMAHLHSVWTASARVVDQARLSGHDKNLINLQEAQEASAQLRNLDPGDVPGTLAKASLTYTPGKVKKIDPA
jgi:hypothetical protein